MLTGLGVRLRAIEPLELERLREWRNRSENRCYFREYREITPVAQQDWYDKICQDDSVEMFAIEATDDNRAEVVGVAGLTSIDWVRRSAEVSIYVGDGYIDFKYAPEALRVLLVYGFRELGLWRVWAETYEYDVLKEELLFRSGFQKEGVLRDAHFADGRHYDVSVHGLLANEFYEERYGPHGEDRPGHGRDG